MNRILDVASKLALEAELKYTNRTFRIKRAGYGKRLSSNDKKSRSCYISGVGENKKTTWKIRVADHPSKLPMDNRMFYLDYRDKEAYFVALAYLGR